MECNTAQPQSILVVDDEPDMRTALSHVLSRNGYSVETASTGVEGIAKFKIAKHHVVITDMKMPEMSGMQVLEAVKKISPQVPVIMITGHGTITKAVGAMKQGASDYILKPFSAETLESALRKVSYKANNEPQTKPMRPCTSQPTRIITQDSGFLELIHLALNVAPSNATVLVLGESGTGKELLASYIHQHSQRSTKSYIAVNCAALPETLAESELFGHEKGSFTGAANTKLGKFELAHGGTILLDEISEMAMPLQAKLLRVLQEREIDRVGGTKPIPIDVRVIAVSNVDLNAAVQQGTFREDLFYRLNVIPVTIPPLRDRRRDIPLLADHFLKKYTTSNNRTMTTISDQTISLLMKYDWKGNVRELENTIERAVLLGSGDVLMPKHLFLEKSKDCGGRNIPLTVGVSLKEMEKQLIFMTLKEVNDNRTHAAKLLGISIRTLRNKLREYKEEK
ncbi:MAG: sigma-54 dependent transcriptional regulator [Thermodesulfobacteriota bacterium]|nr:sigma-54 dependent transcriptional regulator [Thermodesulfobacteriota bacterium]